MKNQNVSFRPMEIMKTYLAGEKFDPEAQRIIRNAVYNLLMLGWQKRYSKLPALVVPAELPLIELPYLDDREKFFLIKQLLGRYSYRDRLFVEKGQVFIERTVNDENYHSENPTRKREEVNLTVKDVDERLKRVVTKRNYREVIPPYDIHSLRVCTLLYRPFEKWTPEEHAIMRGGIKINPKRRQQKFYRASW